MNEDTIYERFNIQENMPHSMERLNYSSETAELADRLGDMELSFEAHYHQCMAAVFANEYAVALNAFTWCVGAFEKDPEKCDSYHMTLMYKWILHNCIEFHGISRHQIAELLNNFRQHLKMLGHSERCYYFFKSMLSVNLGEEAQKIKDEISKWIKLPRDSISDCNACEKASHVWALISMKAYQEAIDTAEPLLKEEITCGAEPHRILAEILIPLAKTGKLEEAYSYHLKGYRLIKNQAWRSPYQFHHIHYLAYTGELGRAMQLFRDHFKDIDDAKLFTYTRFHMYNLSLFFLTKLSEDDRKSIKLRSLKNDRFFDKDGEYNINDLILHFRNEVEEMAGKIDARNGNDHFKNLILSN